MTNTISCRNSERSTALIWSQMYQTPLERHVSLPPDPREGEVAGRASWNGPSRSSSVARLMSSRRGVDYSNAELANQYSIKVRSPSTVSALSPSA